MAHPNPLTSLVSPGPSLETEDDEVGMCCAL